MASNIHQPHDKLFKLALEEKCVAIEFFTAHLPVHIQEKMALNTLQLESHSFIDPAYKKTEADVVYSVILGGSTAYLYLLVEQQTSVDASIAFRLLVYTVRLMERHLKQHGNKQLPLVLPMVIYAGDEPWDAPLEIFPLFGELEALARDTFLQPYTLIDINRISDDTLREQLLFGLVAYALKHRKITDFKQFLKKFMPWIDEVALQGWSGASLTRIVLKYVIDRVQQGDKDLLVQAAKSCSSSELEGEIMTIAQQWEAEGIQKGIQKGMQQGIQKGMQQGIQKGESTLLMHLIQRRFGDVPESVAQRISQADSEKLLLWAEKVLDVAHVEEIFTQDQGTDG